MYEITEMKSMSNMTIYKAYTYLPKGHTPLH